MNQIVIMEKIKMTEEKVKIYSEIHPQDAKKGYPPDDSKFEMSWRSPEEVSIDKVRKSIIKLNDLMSEILSEIPKTDSGFEIDEVKIHALMDRNGGISILGASFGGKVEGGIQLIWKRKTK